MNDEFYELGKRAGEIAERSRIFNIVTDIIKERQDVAGSGPISQTVSFTQLLEWLRPEND
jgi:hypothetical protein